VTEPYLLTPAGRRERFRVVPLSFDQACAMVAGFHRHHRPPRGHKFSIGAARGGEVVGAAMVGRPVARLLQDGKTLEVTRCVVLEGVRHACGFLYAAARRATFALGYDRLVTYNQAGESGSSLRAAGWRVVAQRPARPGWNMPSRPRSATGNEWVERTLWEVSA
jgi:hypothetical protein